MYDLYKYFFFFFLACTGNVSNIYTDLIFKAELTWIDIDMDQ